MKEELYIAFENYLNNEMSSEEKTIFENQLQNDYNLKVQFELYKETTQFLEVKFSNETLDFKDNLKSISNHHFSENKNQKSKVISLQSKWFAIAAVFVVFIGVWFFNSGNPSYSDFNKHTEANFIERSEIDHYLKVAQDYFNSKDYKKAAESFAKIKNLANPEIQLYYAISLIEIDEYSKSNILLENISQGNSVYKEDAIWYLALSSLKQKKYDELKKYLQQITEDSEKYSSAQKLLNDLD